MKLISESTKYAVLLVAVLLATLPIALSETQELQPDKVAVKTPAYLPPSDFEFTEGTYRYEVSWQGIPAALAEISLEEGYDSVHLIATAKTMDWLSLFYRLNYRAEGLADAQSLRPSKTRLYKRENSRIVTTSIDFDTTGMVKSVMQRKGRDPEIFEFNPNNPMLDPISASLLARSLDWKPGMQREFDTFNGKTRYLITLRCTGTKKIEADGIERLAWQITPSVRNLNKNEPAKKLHQASIYVSADGRRDILRIESDVYLGTVVTQMTSFTPAKKQAKKFAGKPSGEIS